MSDEGIDATKVELIPPPPWEVDPKSIHNGTDARRFVACGPEISLRWCNPRLIDQIGWRDWQAVPARGDRRFKLLNKSLQAEDNTIRRGGSGGDILAWMYTSWVESRSTVKRNKVDRQSRAAVDKFAETREEFARGKFGPYVSDGGGMHPTHTAADGRSMAD